MKLNVQSSLSLLRSSKVVLERELERVVLELRALAVLAEDQNKVPNTYKAAHNRNCHSSSKRSDILFWPPRTHTHKIITKLFL